MAIFKIRCIITEQTVRQRVVSVEADSIGNALCQADALHQADAMVIPTDDWEIIESGEVDWDYIGLADEE